MYFIYYIGHIYALYIKILVTDTRKRMEFENFNFDLYDI